MKWLTWDVSGLNPIVSYWYGPRSKWNILQHKGNIDRDHQHNHVIDVIVIEICLHYALHILPNRHLTLLQAKDGQRQQRPTNYIIYISLYSHLLEN